MAESSITFLVLGGAVVLFVSGRVPVAVTAMAVALSLWATGVLDLEEALAGFGDPTVVFIAATFVVAEALDVTGVTAWVGQQLLARAGPGGPRVLVLIMVVCALVTALITPNASVAALIPAVVVIAVRTRVPSSQLLMPLAFGAHAGALLALTGSPVNVLVADAADGAGFGRFGFFSFALVGAVVAVNMADALESADIGALPLLIGFILVIVLLDIIIPGSLPKWAIFAPIFIPLFLRLDVAPQTVLAAYRVGDSPANVITPLMVYLPFIVIVAQRYRKDAGVGTIISLMIPYTAIVLVTWMLFFAAWFLLGIPMGPGYPASL